MNDRDLERHRYELAALAEDASAQLPIGASDLAEAYRQPYIRYEDHLASKIQPSDTVLELGAGSGRHTVALTRTQATIIALDISAAALSVGLRRTESKSLPVCADMEALPLRDNSIDAIASAGSLSYGEPGVVDSEIFRVLRPGGSLLVVDSLNRNALYRLNRWVHYYRGNRTRSTLTRIPDAQRIANLTQYFDDVEVEAFGSYLFLYPALKKIIGPSRSQTICESLDARFGGGPNGLDRKSVV